MIASFVEELLDLVLGNINDIRGQTYEAVKLSQRGYASTENLHDFSSAARRLTKAVEIVEIAVSTIVVMDLALRAQSWHLMGEECFFSEDYKQSAVYHDRAYECMSQCLFTMMQSSTSRDHQDLLRFVTAYRDFLEIETVEARAFEAKQNGAWEVAQRLHEHEIGLTKRAVQKLGETESQIGRRLAGHVWYARSCLLECLAHFAFERGEIQLSTTYGAESRWANQKSVELNPMWGESDKGTPSDV